MCFTRWKKVNVLPFGWGAGAIEVKASRTGSLCKKTVMGISRSLSKMIVLCSIATLFDGIENTCALHSVIILIVLMGVDVSDWECGRLSKGLLDEVGENSKVEDAKEIEGRKGCCVNFPTRQPPIHVQRSEIKCVATRVLMNLLSSLAYMKWQTQILT
jgi:hypothetical protein